MSDIHIQYENLFMIKRKDWSGFFYFVYSHHAPQASFVMTAIVTKVHVVLTKLQWLSFHTNIYQARWIEGL